MTNLCKLCRNVEESDNAFVGLKSIDGKINIYFPLGYEIPNTNEECKKSIFALIKAINLIKKEKKASSYNTKNNDNDIPINSYIWLIESYLKNGLYYDVEKSYKQKINGKINWKRTIRTKGYLSNNNIVYLNPIASKSYKEESIITRIEVLCLKISLARIGFLYPYISLPKININENNITYYISVLKNKLINSYVDYNKDLINNLITILEEKNNSKYSPKNLKYGTYTFAKSWEKMVDKVFGNIKSEEFFPKAQYHLIGIPKFNTPQLYPDTILNYNHNLYILDSKYYKYGITNNIKDLPSTESIDKQITYGEYAKDHKLDYNYTNIYNAFIIPFNKKSSFNSKNVIEYRGYAQSGSTSKTGNYTYEKIAIILLDTKYLMDCYFHKEQINLEEFIQNIHFVEKS